jgi:hypothetical protein
VNRRCWMVLATLTVMALAGTVMADEGWSLSKLNPFKKSTTSARARGSVSDDHSSGLSKYSLTGSKSSSTKKSSQPSTLSKWNQNTKEFFGKTKDTLMPWSKSDTKKAAAHPVSTKKKAKAAEKTPWYKAWWPHEEPKKPKTVSEFIGQERPEM